MLEYEDCPLTKYLFHFAVDFVFGKGIACPCLSNRYPVNRVVTGFRAVFFVEKPQGLRKEAVGGAPGMKSFFLELVKPLARGEREQTHPFVEEVTKTVHCQRVGCRLLEGVSLFHPSGNETKYGHGGHCSL